MESKLRTKSEPLEGCGDSIPMTKAWLQCQQELENPKERAKGNFGSYAKLEDILDQCLPILNKHGFYLFQSCEDHGGQPWMKTEIVYLTGEHMMSNLPMFGDFKDMQKFGAAITYARRYGLCMLLGLEGEKDLDAVSGPAPQPQDNFTYAEMGNIPNASLSQNNAPEYVPQPGEISVKQYRMFKAKSKGLTYLDLNPLYTKYKFKSGEEHHIKWKDFQEILNDLDDIVNAKKSVGDIPF